MAELREENSPLMKQLNHAQNVTRADVIGDAELAGKVDKNANVQTTNVSDEPSASDAYQLANGEPAEQQVVILMHISWRMVNLQNSRL